MSQIVSDVTDILDYKKEKQQAASSRKKILQQMAEDQKTKTNLIKKALATQRAKYGADGMTVVALADAKARGMMRKYAVEE
jgi:hypothetical protein